jgi:hypothetical protein
MAETLQSNSPSHALMWSSAWIEGETSVNKLQAAENYKSKVP